MSNSSIMKKCLCCKKKKVITLECSKCKKMFCITHIGCESHKCDYDHKKDLVICEKIETVKVVKI